LTDLARKNRDTIAQAVADTSVEQLQHLLRDAARKLTARCYWMAQDCLGKT